MINENDYYSVLGVQKEAPNDEIKKAFRQLAKRYHPDVNKDQQAQDKFREVYAAYEVLSDPHKRGIYDYLLLREVEASKQNLDFIYKRYQKYKEKADKEAEYYSQNPPREEEYSEPQSPMIFHLKQVVGLVFLTILTLMGLAALSAGVYFLFFKSFNGHMVAGYAGILVGGGMLYSSIKGGNVLFFIWKSWYLRYSRNQTV